MQRGKALHLRSDVGDVVICLLYGIQGFKRFKGLHFHCTRHSEINIQQLQIYPNRKLWKLINPLLHHREVFVERRPAYFKLFLFSYKD